MATVSAAVAGNVELVKRHVVLEGLVPIMFDRYPGDNDTKLEPWQRLYLSDLEKKIVGLPSLNILSFMSAQNTKSAPKRLLDSRKYRKTADACLSFLMIEPDFIPFVRDGKPITLGSKLESGPDPKSGIYLHRAVARLEDGIPNPKIRPVLPMPWFLEFMLTIFPNKEIQETQVANLMSDGGIALGLGTWRGVFGKFKIARWEEVK
jgi:hypothetical protein